MNQIERIMSLLPHPSRYDIESIGSPYAAAILGQVPHRYGGGGGMRITLYRMILLNFCNLIIFFTRRSQRLSQLLPLASNDAVDLLTQLLLFSTERRLSAHSALHHPYVIK